MQVIAVSRANQDVLFRLYDEGRDREVSQPAARIVSSYRRELPAHGMARGWRARLCLNARVELFSVACSKVALGVEKLGERACPLVRWAKTEAERLDDSPRRWYESTAPARVCGD